MPKTTLSKEETTAMLIQACDAIIVAEPMLSEADRNLGDGDHGLGMQRGMTAAKDKLNTAPPDSVRALVVYDAAPVPPVAMTLTWAEAAVANSKVATMQVARRASWVNRLLANGRIK